MGQRNDCKQNALQTQLAKTGQLNDLFLEWLQTNGATSDDLNDAQIEMLVSQGYTEGSLNDRWYVFLGALGYTGALADRFQQWWCGESGDGSDGGQIASYLINLPLLINRYNTGDNAYNATLDRNSAATVIDHEGLVRTVLPNELRFQGARRVENVLEQNPFLWVFQNAGTASPPVLTDVGGGDYRLQMTLNGGTDALDRATIRSPGLGTAIIPVMSVTVKSYDGGAYKFLFNSADSASERTAEIAESRVSYTRSATVFPFEISIRGSIGGDDTIDILISLFQGEDITGQSNQAPSEFVEPNDSASSDGKIPVRYYDTTNGNTVDANGVVTEASGVALPEPAGLVVEEESENLFLNDNGTQGITTTAQAYTISVTGTGSITLTGTMSGVATAGSPVTATATAGTLTCTVSGDIGIGQVEAKGYVTSAIPTTNASATRLADNAQTSWPADLVNDFVIDCEAKVPENFANRRIFTIGDSFSNNVYGKFNTNLASQFQKTVNSSQDGFGNYTHNAPIGTVTPVAVRCSATQGFSAWVNGIKGVDAPAGIADATAYFTILNIGKHYAVTEYLNSTIKSIRLRKGDLTDDEVING